MRSLIHPPVRSNANAGFSAETAARRANKSFPPRIRAFLLAVPIFS